MSRIRPDPAEFKRCVTLLSRKLESIAAMAGVPDRDCIDLESTLAALPFFTRSRASIVLEGVRAQSLDDDPTMAFAAEYVLSLAHEIWETGPILPLDPVDASDQINRYK
jgi:hypothetical protein